MTGRASGSALTGILRDSRKISEGSGSKEGEGAPTGPTLRISKSSLPLDPTVVCLTVFLTGVFCEED
ncbi:hypothetical protein BT96DRAFT_922044 [Gymnopus androsaceus JB14]|uniref:Uncharacterized protein n=1 Tax=Gymnopus androsaceus JB14 TaxID=1447944 RepID=A0A6A4HG04_9AGAR|nr:hypothetical protein BT96DRAFT_922044 [Gymnopus androsaceus JB14]